MPFHSKKSLLFRMERQAPIVHWILCNGNGSGASAVRWLLRPSLRRISARRRIHIHRANGSPDSTPPDSNFRPDCSCGTALRNPFAGATAQIATHPRNRARSAIAEARKPRILETADTHHS